MTTIWFGTDKTLKDPYKFVAPQPFHLGGVLVPEGAECRQFETRDFGWTLWRGPDGVLHWSRE